MAPVGAGAAKALLRISTVLLGDTELGIAGSAARRCHCARSWSPGPLNGSSSTDGRLERCWTLDGRLDHWSAALSRGPKESRRSAEVASKLLDGKGPQTGQGAAVPEMRSCVPAVRLAPWRLGAWSEERMRDKY